MPNTKGLKRGGSPGRPRGVPNKATRQIKQFCQQLFERPTFQRNLKKAWDDLSLDPGMRQLVMYYAFGKPPTALDLNVSFDLAKYLAREDE